jgi:hypothetical protein
VNSRAVDNAYVLAGMDIRGAVESDAAEWRFGEVLLCLLAWVVNGIVESFRA